MFKGASCGRVLILTGQKARVGKGGRYGAAKPQTNTRGGDSSRQNRQHCRLQKDRTLIKKEQTYLRLTRGCLIVTVWGSAQGRARSVGSCSNASPLREVLFALGLANLDLLLLATTAQLIGLEGVLGLELGAPMLGDVSLSHGCCRPGVGVLSAEQMTMTARRGLETRASVID